MRLFTLLFHRRQVARFRGKRSEDCK